LLVVPSLKLVVVGNGEHLNDPADREGFWGTVEKYVFNPVIDAAAIDPPYPPSSVIKGVKWAPADQIVRLAPGSDNWPMTWADDDIQYTAYGDGWGFEPPIDVKLSLGLAKVLGPPDRIRGDNLRSKSAERVGQGEAGEKASGILMVDNSNEDCRGDLQLSREAERAVRVLAAELPIACLHEKPPHSFRS
jgi:hypothetical protein